MPWPAFLSTAWEMARQLFGLSFRAVDIGIDRLVADALELTTISKTPGDLFGRPANLQLADDMRAQTVQTDKLASSRSPV
ncbi:hypothetical protein OCH239_11000 [Roseivivax halodurans JCM 10272]|uniref:Uncharacterized protein n=1 Tax=Roseivivax halodurans JCM 10272 TaxID=1449350 RepID=X7EE12_9RHOB|nr:hypothetical protein OCH239_11000 [Roseivivax halodurans JCM 10272]